MKHIKCEVSGTEEHVCFEAEVERMGFMLSVSCHYGLTVSAPNSHAGASYYVPRL